MSLALLVEVIALHLITLHQPDGRAVRLNPAGITSLLTPRPDAAAGKLLRPGSNCIVFLADRHYFGVIETCEAVSRLLGGMP